MCCDYKLMAAVLANHLQVELVTRGYFPSHQTGFIRGRSIYEPILRVAEWASFGRYTVCLLDFEKAYDRVQHSWLFPCFEAAGLSKVFKAFVQVALAGASLKI